VTSTPGCAGCASSAGTPYYETAPAAAAPGGSSLPQPEIGPNEAAPSEAQYPGTPVDGGGATPDVAPPATPDPAPTGEASTFNAPQLLGPGNDRTANRPSVDVWNAVYQRPVAKATVSHTAKRAVAPQRTQAEIDAEGWYSVPAAR
jgi:hypothetical protein